MAKIIQENIKPILDNNVNTINNSLIYLLERNRANVELGLSDGTKDLTVKNITVEDITMSDTLTLFRLLATPSATTAITAAGGISQTQLVMNIQGLGGAINITANPQISNSSTGEFIILIGKSDTNTVTLDDGTGLVMKGGQSCTLGDDDIWIGYYDGTSYIELTRGIN